MSDTIFAPATPAGGAIAIIRISGPEAIKTVQNAFTGRLSNRKMIYGKLNDKTGTIDGALVCAYEAPHSYTGEDMAEIFLHGGSAVVKRALSLLALTLRPAAPGEFTERAFLNGKLDLSEAEAVMDIINATTERGARSAVEQLEGSVGRRIAGLEEELMAAITALDAALDFPDELELDTLSALPGEAARIAGELSALIEAGIKGRYLREGARIAILGAPNAGKSSLFNALVGRERAIVTAVPGTTRDVLDENIEISGVPVRLIDTAGLRETEDEAERIGVSRAEEAGEQADILLLAFDAMKPLTEGDRALIEQTGGRARIAVFCKADMPSVLSPKDAGDMKTVEVSSVTLEGMEELRNMIADMLLPEQESALVTNSRHIASLERARAELIALDILDGADCASLRLRAALAALGEITGREVSEEIIDRIFRDFCVGK